MRLIPQILAIALLGFVAELILPWYSVAFVAFVLGYWLTSESNFLGGFIAIALLWGIKIAVVLNGAATDLADRVALIFPFKERWILILVTLLIGALVGGLSAMTGGMLKKGSRAAG
jgi:uncharacterized membrane protein